ncbi:MAG: hypothetical protein O7I42_26255 [Alphaproteobacteria bacterium]|nr:hypothetical protein [Alphaproteobacteria bacterium]
MAKKNTTGKLQTRRKPVRSKASESRNQRTAMTELGAAVQSAQRYAEDLQTHAIDGLNTAVEDVQKRQKKLQASIAEIGKRSMKSVDSKVVAMEKALGDFDAFIAKVGAGIDKEWEALSKRSAALREQLEELKAEAVKRTDKGYATAENAVEDFDKFVERNAASLEKDVLAFMDRAEPQIKSLREAIASYSAKSAELARSGGSGVAELWSDLTLHQKNAQKQFNLFSKSSARAWKDMTKGLDHAWLELSKARRSAASRYVSKDKSATSGKTKTSKAKAPTKKPASQIKPAANSGRKPAKP